MARLIIKGMVFALLMALPSYGFAHESACAQLLEPGRQAKILERLQKLNPEIHQKFSDRAFSAPILEELYLALKTEAWQYLPKGQIPFKDRPVIAADLGLHLRTEYAKQFATEKLTEDGLYLFYANAIWSLYISVYQTWLGEVVNDKAAGVSLSREQKSFGVSLLGRGLIDFDMQSPSTSPKIASQVFIDKSWEKFPWTQGFKIAADWQEVMDAEGEKPTYENLREWLNVNPAYLSMSATFRNLVIDALKYPGTEDVCCLTDPGCAFCPNNRLSRRNQ